MIKQLMNSAFIGCEELYRSRWITPSEIIFHNSSYPTQPPSLIANEFSNEKENNIKSTFKNK